MSSRAETTANLIACYDELEGLMDRLGSDDWSTQSLCPDWTVRGVIIHLASIEHVLTGWVPTAEANVPPFDRAGEFAQRAEGLGPDDLVAEVKAVLAARRADLAAMSDEEFGRDSMTPVGPGTYHRFMDIRVFDFWVHQRDMTHPLGWDTDDSGPSAERSVDEVDMSIGYIVGKKIGLPDGMGIAFELTGPVTRTIAAAVDGRAARVDTLDAPDVTVTTDSTTFVQLACGRIDPQGPIDAGRITWSGNAEWGEKAARNLAFTM